MSEKRRTASKLLSLVLALGMLLGLLPTVALAAPDTSGDTTEANVTKVESYAAQLLSENKKDNYSKGGFTWDTEGKKDSWRYFNGVMLDAFLMAKTDGSVDFATAFYNDNISVTKDEDGTITDVSINKYGTGELDSVPAALGLFDLLDTANAGAYKAAIQYIYTQLENQTSYDQCGGNYLHKQEDDGTPTSSWSEYQIGLDGLYMAQPFLMECANAIDAGTLTLKAEDGSDVKSADIYKAVYDRFVWVADAMYEKKTGLYHHGWNVESSTGNGHFWGRGIGWYAVALVDVIEMMPDNSDYAQYRTNLIANLKTLFDGMLKYQDSETGMWYNVVNRGADLTDNNGNRLETSVSAMMAYALMKAYNNGYVGETYGQAGLKAFNGVVENKMPDDNTVTDIYQKSGVGKNDKYYVSEDYVNNEAKGVGALIMAATQATKAANSLPDPDPGEGEGGDEGDTQEPASAPVTEGTIIVTGVSSITVTEADEASKDTIATKLEAGFYAYDIVPDENYTDGTEVQVTMPAPDGADAVYYVPNDGDPVKMEDANFEGTTVTFTTDHFSVYAAGVETQAEQPGEYNWKEIPGGTYFTRATSMESGTEYVILYQGYSSYALHYRDNNDVNGQTVNVTPDNGQYAITANHGEVTTWRYDNGKIYCTVNGQDYYLYRDSNSAKLTTLSDYAISNWEFVAQDRGAVRFDTGKSSLRWNDSDWQIREKSGIRDLYLYEKHTTPGGQAALTGTLSHTVKVGSSLTEAQIKEAAFVLYRAEASAEESPISWDKVTTVWDTSLNTNAVGTYTMTVSYEGVELGTITVSVQESVLDKTQPNWGLNPAGPEENYPEYPDDGAVRIWKTADTDSTNFNSTGVVEVELDVAGISVKRAVDVVLVVDVSNSMGWSVENSGNTGGDVKKIPSDGQTQKLQDAMKAADAFAEILLQDNEQGSADNNTISFVTFAGYDKDHYSGSQDYIDSVQTVFTGVEEYEKARISFEGTYFSSMKQREDSTSVDYTLQITDESGVAVSGINRGNTNYDYAFWEANRAVNTLQDNDYENSGRETIVVFMTDGAPSHYQNDRAQGNADDRLPGEPWSTYPENEGYYDADGWLARIQSTDNEYATSLYNNVDGFYAIGFDLAHGGFNNFQWEEDELTAVLAGMVAEATIPVMAASDSQTLQNFYESLARQIMYAGTEAEVTDTIKSDFTLQTTTIGSDDSAIAPTIKVTSYEVYAVGDVVNGVTLTEDSHWVGTRKGDGTPVETVEFGENGTATSNLKEGNIRTVGEDGTVTIAAYYFTYTKTAEGVETFKWNIGNITNSRLSLSYYAYLKGSMEGDCPAGTYDTNEKAYLEYVDINGNYAWQPFPVPDVPWQGAVTRVEYYLVNQNGQPVNTNGVVIPFEYRIQVGTTADIAFNWNESITVSGAAYPPGEGYVMYSPNASYTVTSNSEGTGTLEINDTKPISGSNDTYSTRIVSQDRNCANTTVAFGVYLTDQTPESRDPLKRDQIVMDYGKFIQVDVTEGEAEGATYKPVGFVQYNSATNVNQTYLQDGGKTSIGVSGSFSLVTNADGEQVVQYTPSAMLSTVEKVFVVVQVTPTNAPGDAYRMLNELDIIPATVMLYETDFADTAFTFQNGVDGGSEWLFAGTSSETGQVQNDGTIGVNQTYGFDSTYADADDKTYSNGTSYWVEGNKATDDGSCTTTATFSFTGTGFDIISRTGEQQGQIRVTVTDEDGQEVKKIKVLNKSETKWELYQIPVVSVNDLTYGTYQVMIEVYQKLEYTSTVLKPLERGGQFFFDAVRIYSPINASASANATSDAGIAYAAYVQDGEASNQIFEVRKSLIDGQTFWDDGSGEEYEGAVFVDRYQGTATEGVYTIANYEAIGPNNEVYLSPGQGIAFEIKSNEIPASIDIGAKSADGNPVTMSANIASSNNEAGVGVAENIVSSTAQYYDLMKEADCTLADIFATDSAYVVILNIGDSGVLSITDLKIAYGSQASEASLGVDSNIFDVVNHMMGVEVDQDASDQKTPDYDIQSAAFNSDTCKIRGYATMTVQTTDDVSSLVITDKNGKTVNADITQVSSDSGITWTVSIRMTVMGNRTYTVTGYGADNVSGAPASDTIRVTLR